MAAASVRGAHHTSFTVAELSASVAFFRDALGLELLWEREIADDYFGQIVGLPGARVRAALFKLPGGHHLELFQYLSPRGVAVSAKPCDPGSSHLALLVDDLAGLTPRLKSQGATLVSEPVFLTGGPSSGGQAIYLRDPNGVLIELFQPKADPA